MTLLLFHYYLLLVEPHSHQGKQLVNLQRFGDVIGSAGFNTFLTVALHRFCSDGNNGKKIVLMLAPDFLSRFISVHFRHHDIHQHHVNLRIFIQDIDSIFPAFCCNHINVVPCCCPVKVSFVVDTARMVAPVCLVCTYIQNVHSL